MGQLNLLQENQSYTYRSYFEMTYEPDQILGEFGYRLLTERLSLPHFSQPYPQWDQLKQDLEESLKLTLLTSEAARRETLVGPILFAVARFGHYPIRLEYTLFVNQWLKGNLDYFLRGEQSLLVVEAKNEDLTRGFTQLGVEMIALSQVEPQDVFYGAVTLGDVWRFGKLNRAFHSLTQDISLYRVPDDLDELMRILIGILKGSPPS
jgi:hypothetical protein